MAQHGVGLFPTQHPQSSVPQGLAVSPAPPVAEERLWPWAVALGDVPRWCARSHLSIGQSQAVHQWGWFAPAAQTSAREGGGGDTALLGPAQLTEAARWDTGREERKEGDPLPCQAAGIQARKRLSGFFVLSPAAGAQKMGIVLLWGNLRGVWTGIQETPCHKPGSKGKSSKFCCSSQGIPRTVHEDTTHCYVAMPRENHG